MRIAIILEGSGGELDRAIVDVKPNTPDEALSEKLKEQLAGWILSVGDTIKIVEVE